MGLKGEQTATGISCYCNIASIPFLILPWLFSDFMNTSSGERSFVANAPQPRWIVVLLLSGIGSYTIGVANFNLRKLVTATSLSVANVSYKLVSTLFSVLPWNRLDFSCNCRRYTELSWCCRLHLGKVAIASAEGCLYIYNSFINVKISLNKIIAI